MHRHDTHEEGAAGGIDVRLKEFKTVTACKNVLAVTNFLYVGLSKG